MPHRLAKECPLPNLRLHHRQRNAGHGDLQGNRRRTAARTNVDDRRGRRHMPRGQKGSRIRRSTAASGSSSAVRFIRRFQTRQQLQIGGETDRPSPGDSEVAPPCSAQHAAPVVLSASSRRLRSRPESRRPSDLQRRDCRQPDATEGWPPPPASRPGTRPACPTVSGRVLLSRSTTSRERPGTPA